MRTKCINKIVLGWIVLSVLLLNGCVVGKKVVYVKDMGINGHHRILDEEPMKLQKGDRLRITVSSKNPELAAPFNGGVGAFRIDGSGNVEAVNEQTKNAQSYLINSEGMIDFPVLGKMMVAGMPLEKVTEKITTQLKTGGMIADALVKVELLNFKVSVTGAVLRENVLHAENAEMTLMEALALSGGLKPNAAPDQIKVIREEDGIRRIIVHDIESKSFFDSPAYHLRQNDIVYVTPRSAEDTPRENRSWRFWSTAMGLISIALAALTLAK
ncbi:polysaccharide biosynthesis/export family protein [Sphingobacterium faecale]|uniref:Polysaccharide biosynthesis/export family protein n=1 Tax=Sphingobacterium faecale TaxID=2803775 RepID=A0ABS1QXX2_9SPHI|nr:polysaccharide biosynthesis/export family protein [Sphingobacterium faecale]MBL1407281.1 polysaccharide biosynthesis/export family protein [Sphingobacterium faecale]